MLNELRDESFVFFLGVLLVEDAVLFVLEADAAEEICSLIVTIVAVEEIAAVRTDTAEGEMKSCHARMIFVNEFSGDKPAMFIAVHAIL